MDSGRRDNGEMPKNVCFLLPHLSLIHGTSRNLNRIVQVCQMVHFFTIMLHVKQKQRKKKLTKKKQSIHIKMYYTYT